MDMDCELMVTRGEGEGKINRDKGGEIFDNGRKSNFRW